MGGTPKTVLVLDDEPSIRLLCRVNLELEGYRVLEAGTLDAGRELLDAEDVDVLLLDLHVEGRDGFELLRELRDRDTAVRVALLTGSVDTASIDTSLADATVTKPFAIDDLTGVVQRLAHAQARIR